jgi:hypothetical protein
MPHTTLRSGAGLAGPGRRAAGGEPAGKLGDGGAIVGVAAKPLGDQDRLLLDDLVAGTVLRGLAPVAVAERGAGQDVDRPGAGPIGLAAPVALGELGLLVLGEPALELDQQLVLGAVTARALDELGARAGAGELLDQHRLVGELAGQPVRGIAPHHIDADSATRSRSRSNAGRTRVAPEWPSSSKTHSSGSSRCSRAAYARSAAVCEAIVWSVFCRADDTRA